MDDSTPENETVAENSNSFISKSCLVKFTESTSLHGLRYIGEKGNSKFERSLWMVAISISLGLCSFLIAQVWTKWTESPVIVTLGETTLSTWDIPFPMVTICPLQVIKNSSFEYRGSCERNLTDSEIFKYQSISLLCSSPYGCYPTNFTDESSIHVFRDVGLGVDDFISVIRYNGDGRYRDALQPTLTWTGICYSFNMMEINQIYKKEVINYKYLGMVKQSEKNRWSLDKGYPDDSEESEYPLRVMGTGLNAGLSTFLFRNLSEIENQCSGAYEGFKVSFNSPNSPPTDDDDFIYINFKVVSLIEIEPEMTTTSESLRKYDPEKRQCYFENERSLRFFRVYTQKNCEVECIANMTLKLCDCVPFYLPRAEGTKICSTGKDGCVFVETPEKIRIQERKGRANFKYDDACNCLPGCVSLKYKPIINQTPFNYYKDERYDSFKRVDMSKIQIIFKTTQFITSKRSELYGMIDFLAYCGGLLGLCLGFSILSLFEIIYFIIFRCMCKLKKN